MNNPEAVVKRPKLNQRPKELTRADVVEAIRQGILANDLAPGQRLVEAEICDLLGASRGNVRAALMDLVHEGLVEHIANRGARVRAVGLAEALQIAEVRMVVESLCVGRAAERISDEGIESLRGLAEKLKAAAGQNDVATFADLTHQVFETYLEIADQPVAHEVLERLRARGARHRFRLTYRPGRPQVSLPYWLEIIDAICRRDVPGARKALERHAENVRETMRAVEHEQPPGRASHWS
jgi:DNA-binding GntR family transcriptional regulator